MKPAHPAPPPVAFRRAGAVALSLAVVLATGFEGCNTTKQQDSENKDKKMRRSETKVESTRFKETNDGEPYNASGIVPIGDGRFLVCDNNIDDALLELTIDTDGSRAKSLVRQPLIGLAEGAVDDMEDVAEAEVGGHAVLFAMPSLSVQGGSKKKGRGAEVRPGGIVRITRDAGGNLMAEAMPDFRDWLVANCRDLAPSAANEPDSGGLNVEGLAWDPNRGALLLGVRTPVLGNTPIVVPVRVRDLAGPWTTANLEALPPIHLAVEPASGEQGVRGMGTNAFGGGFLVLVGNSTSESRAGFSLYVWDGGDTGAMRRLPVTFSDKMKPEGVTTGTVGGKEAVVIVDDAGGFAVIWRDDAGL